MKVFNNMKRPTKGFLGQEVALFPTMLVVTEPSTSPSRITSSPSHSPEPSTQHSPDNTTAAASQPSPTQPSPTHPSPGAEHHVLTPHDSPLHAVYSRGSDEGSLKLNELMNLVTKLFDRIGVLEADLMKIKKTYKVQEKPSTDTELFIQEVTPTEVIQDQEGSKKASDEVNTAGAKKGTASEEVPIVSTAEVNPSTAGGTVTYSRMSAEKRSRQDKGKAIMIEEEPKKKSKKELEQERLSYAEAIRLEEQMNEEQRAQIARDEEIARQWDEEERQRAMDEAKSAKKIDWNDPSPIDAEHGSGKQKSPEKSPEKMKSAEKMEEDVVAKETGAKRKKSIPRKSTRKRQKMEEDAENEELKGLLDIIPREEVPIEVESISTKGDGSSKNYKILSEMLEDFDRLDVEELYRLVKERYSTSRP
ncbi:hypothetical protein Tco_1496151, partial [Tanacetum coccineum]